MTQFTSPRAQRVASLRKPRNPLVVPALKRKAGRHQLGSASRRQRARQDLALELRQLREDTRSP
ncbi:hypothetical protein LZ017_15140 [Pelomonas sp. CA6]|uniref:hypothetical protein n=1 Tax=Pelomonas sp. CA6 TaxID=2907999 RepID=UPI001F4C2EA5|nr:hypothetical protein [Pelomonas sp. CA6]MCH7344716.1 hypothetical protein [Pelomonas sp. CA6]